MAEVIGVSIARAGLRTKEEEVVLDFVEAFDSLATGVHAMKKKPNKSPEPTSCTVMPRATVCFCELKLPTEFRSPARVMPVQAVAHL